MSTDRIEKKIVLRAARARVWRAISDAKEFGTWFGLRAEAPFVAGAKVAAVIVPTQVDPEVAAKQKQFDGFAFEMTIDRVEPESLFSFRWHPAAVDKGVDYSKEPTTLVVFALREVPEGVELTITESGFDRLPPERRAKAFASNEPGWAGVVQLVAKYLAT